MKNYKNQAKGLLSIIGLFLFLATACEKDHGPDVTTLEVTDITPVSAKTGGIVSAEEGQQVISKGVVWNTSGKPTYENYEGRTNQGEGPGDFNSTLTNLLPETTYYVRAYAVSSEGTGYGKEVSFVTLSGENTVMDADGNIYLTVTLGNQVWMAENLRTTKYRNNSSIITGLSNTEWAENTSGIAAYALYPHQGIEGINSPEEMAHAYGLLYNWYAVNDSRGLCPAGWSVPRLDDWSELINYLRNEHNTESGEVVNGDGNALKIARQVNHPWGGEYSTTSHPRFDAHEVHFGKDLVGMAIVPGGVRQGGTGLFEFIGAGAFLWTSEETSVNAARLTSTANEKGGYYYFDNYSKGLGLSVRCMKYLDGSKSPEALKVKLKENPGIEPSDLFIEFPDNPGF